MKSIETKSKINGKTYKSKSQLIKTLHFEKGVSIKDIAEKEQIRYQQVRNIVVNERNQRLVNQMTEVEETVEE